MPILSQTSSATPMLWVEKYRRALLGERPKQILEFACALGIHSHHGFVDDENPRFVYQRRAKHQVLISCRESNSPQVKLPASVKYF